MIESQNTMILNYLLEHGSITPVEAEMLFSCRRLSARVFDIKAKGYNVKRKDVYVPNQFGKKCQVSIYYLEG